MLSRRSYPVLTQTCNFKELLKICNKQDQRLRTQCLYSRTGVQVSPDVIRPNLLRQKKSQLKCHHMTARRYTSWKKLVLLSQKVCFLKS